MGELAETFNAWNKHKKKRQAAQCEYFTPLLKNAGAGRL